MKKLIVNPLKEIGKIEKEVYGHFSEHLGRCIYEGIYVGKDSPIPNKNGMRTDVVDALRKIQIPVLRWPGGCFADEYHWRDGIGKKEKRKKIINTHWGGIVEDNSFGTHEFFELCSQLGCKAYINGNVGSGSVRELSEWVEYMTFQGQSPMTALRKENGRIPPWEVSYLGIGNEHPEYYADLYRHFSTYCRNYYDDKKMYKIACGPNADDYGWTKRLLERLDSIDSHHGSILDGISLHYYTVPNNWAEKGSATDFDQEVYYTTLKKTLKMEELIQRHTAIMDMYDWEKKLGLIIDEWGTWYDVEPGTNPGFLYQQNTMRDALVAAINLNIFNNHADRVKMANIAQLVNVLQALILTEGDKMILTPTYFVFDMYRKHQGCTAVDSYIQTEDIGLNEKKVPCLHQSVSMTADGNLNMSIVNLSASKAYEVDSILLETKIENVNGVILTNKIDAYNTFGFAERVKTEKFTDYTITGKGIRFMIPPCSVLQLTVNSRM